MSSRRSRTLLAAALALGLLVLVLAVRTWTWDASSSPDPRPPTTSAEPPSTVDAPSYGAGRRDLTFVDATRPTEPLPDLGVEAQPDRTLPTVVLYPTDGHENEPLETDGDVADGTFPLVVFSHGSSGDPETYAPLVEPLARAGYIVALPEYPLTSRPGSPVDDARNQPADVSYILTQLLDLSAGDGWLAGRIDPDHIGAAGHSLGAVTTVGVTYDVCCADPRIKAAVALAGVAVESGPQSLANRPRTPLLLVHGAKDDVVPLSGSDSLFAEATGPVYYLRLDNADHISFGLGDDGELTQQVVRAFLDAELKELPAGLAAIPDAVAASGRGVWETRNT